MFSSDERDAEIERLQRDRDEQQEFREHAESERDEARAEIERLRGGRDAALARVAELDQENDVLRGAVARLQMDKLLSRNGSPAGRETGQSVTQSQSANAATEETSQGGEAVAWASLWPDESIDALGISKDRVEQCAGRHGIVVPLFRAPQPLPTAEERDLIAGITDDDEYTEDGQKIAKSLLARSGTVPALTLTAEEREAVDRATRTCTLFDGHDPALVKTLRGLLERAGEA